MTHFNKLYHYDEDYYDDYDDYDDYDLIEHEIDNEMIEPIDRTDFAMCSACKIDTKWDHLMLYPNKILLCTKCVYNLDREDELDEILEEAYDLSEDEIARLRNTHDTYLVKDNYDFDNTVYNFNALQENNNEDSEAYQEKQFEDYLRLNQCDEYEENELPPLGISTAEKVERAKKLLANYIDIMTEHNKNTCLSQIEDQVIEICIDKYIMNNQIQTSTKEEESEPLMSRCRGDDSQREYITCCECGEYEEEIYSFRYKSSLYCNTCAYEVCGILIDKPINPIKDYSHDEDTLLDA